MGQMRQISKWWGSSIGGRRSLVPALLGALCLPLPASLPLFAQGVMDLSDPRFALAVARNRVKILDASRRSLAERLLSVAGQVESVDPGRRRITLLGEAQQLADSIALLEAEYAEADSALCALNAAADTAGAVVDPVRAAHPLSSAARTLSGLARVVLHERRRLRTIERLQGELRLFMGNLRILDETGMPPSVRTASGGDPGTGGCGIPSCPIDVGRPADMPLEHFEPERYDVLEAGGGGHVTVSSLSRLHEQLLPFLDEAARRAGEADRVEGSETREIGFELGMVSFRGEGEGHTGASLRAGSSLSLVRSLGAGAQLTVEPWVGLRSVHLDPGPSVEMAVEARETLTGASEGGGLRWQVTSWQKARSLSDPLPLPAYLEPGRGEGGVAGRVGLPLGALWAVEVGGGGDAVRYGPADWRSLDHRGLNVTAAMVREGDAGSARLSVLASTHGFPHDPDARRDTRMGVGAEASIDGRIVLRIYTTLAWNDSRLPAYDFRSERLAVVLCAPWRRGSIQAYGAFARQSYLNPGSEELRVAPSDRDAGSILAMQLTRPWGRHRTLTLKVGWSRSETGFANDFYQRFGTSVQVAFRGSGGA